MRVFLCRLIDVNGPYQISLAFNSLIHIFKDVKVELKSVELDPQPDVPSYLNRAHNLQQVP